MRVPQRQTLVSLPLEAFGPVADSKLPMDTDPSLWPVTDPVADMAAVKPFQ